jgi:hypothetical protein
LLSEPSSEETQGESRVAIFFEALQREVEKKNLRESIICTAWGYQREEMRKIQTKDVKKVKG